MDRGLTLPSHHGLTSDDVGHIAESLSDFLHTFCMRDTTSCSSTVRGSSLPGSDTLEVIDSTTEAGLRDDPGGRPADMDRAVAAAKAAFPAWSERDGGRAGKFLRRVAEALEARRDEIAAVIAHEVGMPKHQALTASRWVAASPVSRARRSARLPVCEELRERARHAGADRGGRLHHAVELPAQPDRREGRLHHRGRLHRGAEAVGGRAGERVRARRDHRRDRLPGRGVQPRERARAGRRARRSRRTPTWTWCRSPGRHAPVARVAELAAHVHQEGRARARRQVAERDARRRRLPEAVAAGVDAAYENSGQTCNALTRMLVPRSRLAEVEEIARAAAESYTVGDPFADDTQLGPLVSSVQLDRVRGYIEQGIAEGAKLVTGGAERARRPRHRLLREADGVLERHRRHDHRPGGDLRAGAGDHAVRHRGRSGRDRERHRVRARSARCR